MLMQFIIVRIYLKKTVHVAGRALIPKTREYPTLDFKNIMINNSSRHCLKLLQEYKILGVQVNKKCHFSAIPFVIHFVIIIIITM